MSPSQSLADYLGLDADLKPRHTDEPEVDYASLTGQQFAQKVLSSPEFRSYIVRSLTLGELPPAILAKLMDHGWGKPADKVEFEDKTKTLEAMTRDEALARIDVLRAVISAKRDDAASV